MLDTFYALASITLPIIMYQLFTGKHGKNIEDRTSYFIGISIFIVYLHLVFSVTGFGSIWDIGRYDTLIRREEINFALFQSEGIMVYVLNILMLVPLGFLLPTIWKQYRDPLKVLLVGFSLSLLIEISQLFNRRNSDVNDLLMNTIGAIIGYFIWLGVKSLFKTTDMKDTTYSSYEAIFYITLAVAGRFLLYNWRILI